MAGKEFHNAGWRLRVYARNRSGNPTGAAVHDMRAFVEWELGSAADTAEGRRVAQVVKAVTPLDYNVMPGRGARLTHLLQADEDRWFAVDGIVYMPGSNTMELSLSAATWSTNEVTN